MQGSTSKLRNVYGETHKEKFEDVKPHETSTEGSLIDVNTHFLAVRNIFYFRFHGQVVEVAVSVYSMQQIFQD